MRPERGHRGGQKKKEKKPVLVGEGRKKRGTKRKSPLLRPRWRVYFTFTFVPVPRRAKERGKEKKKGALITRKRGGGGGKRLIFSSVSLPSLLLPYVRRGQRGERRGGRKKKKPTRGKER